MGWGEEGAVTNKYVAFDIEIAKEIPEGYTDWPSTRPGISCAATMQSDGDVILWHASDVYHPGKLPRFMSPQECQNLACYLLRRALQGYKIITFNGLGFDFQILVQESNSESLGSLLKELAAGPSHIDMMFAFFCDKGFAVGLDAVAKGMGLAGKPEGMDGSLAPKLWAQGREEQQRVLDYVAQDVRTTGEIYRTVSERHQLNWFTRSGQVGFWRLPYQGWASVPDALALPEPDVSWMTDPWPRSKFYGWLGEIEEVQ